MPIVHTNRKRQVEEELTLKAKKCKLNQHEMFAKIGYTADHHHTLIREIPVIGKEFDTIVRKEVGSLLNGNGGIIAFGVRTTGTILGNKLTRKEEDNFKLAVDRIMTCFHPIVKPTMYKLTIEPVYDKYKSWISSGLFLIQLKINKGEQYSLYEDGEHEVYIRCGSNPKGPLTAREIKERVTVEYKQRCKESNKKEVEMQLKKDVVVPQVEKSKVIKEEVSQRHEESNKKKIETKVKKENITVPQVEKGKMINKVPRVDTKPQNYTIIKILRPLITKNN